MNEHLGDTAREHEPSTTRSLVDGLSPEQYEAIGYENATVDAVREVLTLLVRLAAPIWRWGDGTGGSVVVDLYEEALRQGLEVPGSRARSQPKKQPVPSHLRWEVWERDDFTCRHCGARAHLEVDHIHPESLGGEMVVDNLQTLCGTCNRAKGNRV